MNADVDHAQRDLLELRDEARTLHAQAAGRDQLTVRTRRVGERRLVIALVGELDLATAPRLDAELRDAAEARLDVTIDLDGLEFFDSTGLTLLLRTAERARDGAGALELVAPPPCVRDVVALTRTADVLPFAPA